MESAYAPIHIALAADSNYMVPLTVALKSIAGHHAPASVHIYLLFIEGHLASSDLTRISDFAEAHRLGFTPLEVSADRLSIFPDSRHGKSTLLRLFLPEMLPALDKILYLDGDIVVTDNLQELFNTPLDAYYVAAARDSATAYGLAYQTGLGIADTHWYFNAGVTLLNLQALRDIGLPERVADFATRYYDHIKAPDQDALNYVCQHGKTRYIHPRYNMNYSLEKDIARKIWGADQIKEACARPAIIHYIGPVKPWSVLSVHPRRKEWWKVVRLTHYAGYACKDATPVNRLRKMFLLVAKPIEAQFSLETKQRIGKLIPPFVKKRIKKSLLKSS